MPKTQDILDVLRKQLTRPGLVRPMKKEDAARLAKRIGRLTGGSVYPESIAICDGTCVCIARKRLDKFLIVIGDTVGFSGDAVSDGSLKALVCEMTHRHAMLIRGLFDFTAPKPIGLATSFGAGDRLGLATPGHIKALKGSGVVPILAQQSIREMTRTGRTPDDVMDSATWGVLQTGYRGGFGSDADHLKTFDDVDRTAAAGFTLFTIDPKAHVDDNADTYDADALDAEVRKLPWKQLKESMEDNMDRYVGRDVKLPGGLKIKAPSREDWMRAAVKYGRAVVHTVRMKNRIRKAKKNMPWELEMSVDETDSPTSVFEHYYVAAELARLGVKPVSLAPRFIGDFEKGVDYIGDLKKLEKTLKYHIGISKLIGPYKLSLHSGSDKFSVYPIASKVCGKLVHVKTAGTSYLEAIRAIATITPRLFRRIVTFAHQRYDTDKATYHVSGKKENAPTAKELNGKKLPKALDQFDLRQMLHVTYGSVLTARKDNGEFLFYDDIIKALKTQEDVHYDVLARHIRRHVKSFSAVVKANKKKEAGKKPAKRKSKKK